MIWYIMVSSFVLGLFFGSMLVEWSWRNLIEQKAKSGFRLECRGHLYNVTLDKEWECVGEGYQRLGEQDSK